MLPSESANAHRTTERGSPVACSATRRIGSGALGVFERTAETQDAVLRALITRDVPSSRRHCRSGFPAPGLLQHPAFSVLDDTLESPAGDGRTAEGNGCEPSASLSPRRKRIPSGSSLRRSSPHRSCRKTFLVREDPPTRDRFLPPSVLSCRHSIVSCVTRPIVARLSPSSALPRRRRLRSAPSRSRVSRPPGYCRNAFRSLWRRVDAPIPSTHRYCRNQRRSFVSARPSSRCTPVCSLDNLVLHVLYYVMKQGGACGIQAYACQPRGHCRRP